MIKNEKKQVVIYALSSPLSKLQIKPVIDKHKKKKEFEKYQCQMSNKPPSLKYKNVSS